VLFLDEPTTGLDPESRAQVWRVVHAAKAGRAIVLTTHSMEEADALTDRIGIMAAGKLRCLATQLRLKKRFGDGLQLKINLAPGADDRAVHDFVQSHVTPDARLDVAVGSARTFLLPGSIPMSKVFESMAGEAANHGIREWAVNQASLEDVFVKLVESAEAEAILKATAQEAGAV